MRTVYVKMDHYNVLRECKEDEQHLPRNIDPRVDPFIVPLITALAKKRPAWRYVTKGFGDLSADGSHYHFNRFTIMEGDEELGEIWKSRNWRTGESRYAMENPRLRLKRNRGNCNETKDLKKAVKTITENMFARTLPEVMDQSARDARQKVQSVSYSAQRDHRYLRDRMMGDIMAFVAANYDAFICTGASTLQDKEKLLDTYERAKEAEVIEAGVGKTGALVVERSGQLHVEYETDVGTYHSYTLDALPARLKEAVALLKLYEPGKLLDGVGIRTDDKTFYILNGAKS